jgi:acyl carrier protein phosphodiesterase
MAKVELQGWERFNRRLAVIIRNITKDVIPTIRVEADEIRKEMKRIAPVDTGFLRDHIVERDIPEGAEIESEAPYSGYLEHGTSRMFPQPFFRIPLILGIRRLMKRLKTTMVKFT